MRAAAAAAAAALTPAFSAPPPPLARRACRASRAHLPPSTRHLALPRCRRRRAAPPVATASPTDPASSPPNYHLQHGQIAVRFINAPDGQPRIAAASVGDNLMRVADSVQLHIPRSCQTGVCGTCTCDVIDPNAPSGRQTVRACQTSVTSLDHSNELVVDVSRMRSTAVMKNALARFENLDTEYVPRAPPRPRGSVLRLVDCATCATSGLVSCDACDGVGEDGGFVCALCAGTGTLRCGDCQGTGEMSVRSR